ncbi:MAG: DUF2784 domain-containing protein [Planctomycetia bacterium]|nr:DUF2784 domain-containing protein [Planctomycetia bacterium]
MSDAMLADLVVAVHVAYVGFVVGGLLAIVLGALLRWQWVRNRWFRLLHTLAILIVAGEALANVDCPLTVWENELRIRAGQDVSEATFIGRCLHDLIFFDFPPWIFTSAYVGFALLVLATLVFVPPCWRAAH